MLEKNPKMRTRKSLSLLLLSFFTLTVFGQSEVIDSIKVGNPIIKDRYTADPAALVYNDTVYLYVGHDEAPDNEERYVLNEWLIYYSTDMVTWTLCQQTFKATEFKWARGEAWAAQVVEKDGKFYWYVTVEHATKPGKAIGVAVADKPTGPFKDLKGSAIITNDMTTNVSIGWDDIDPTFYFDEKGQGYLYWGNSSCKYVKMKDNMMDMADDIQYVDLPHFTEAPYLHKRGDWYYLTYAYMFPEKIAYAMSKSLEGPWNFKGILNEVAGNSNTNHQSIIEYKGKWYFIYHNGSIPTHGGSFRRSVCIDYLYYNEDNTLKRVQMTTEGIDAVK